jgi:hypothetical protein
MRDDCALGWIGHTLPSECERRSDASAMHETCDTISLSRTLLRGLSTAGLTGAVIVDLLGIGAPEGDTP